MFSAPAESRELLGLTRLSTQVSAENSGNLGKNADLPNDRGLERNAPSAGVLNPGLTQRLECDAYNVEVGGSNPSARTIPSDGLFHLKRASDSTALISPEFLDRFLLSFSPEPTSGCWLWLKCLTAAGYGQVNVDGRPTVAHRVSYELFVGPIPFGLTLDHLCRIRCCINPVHVEPVSRGENVRRGDAGLARGLQLRSRTICPSGHEYSGRNLVIKVRRDGSVHRHCRACSVAYTRAFRAAARALPVTNF